MRNEKVIFEVFDEYFFLYFFLLMVIGGVWNLDCEFFKVMDDILFLEFSIWISVK